MNRSAQTWFWIAIACCITGIYLYPLALPTPLLDPDEGIHATIAQEMVERGDYLVPRFCGEVFRDKPFLYSAAQAVSLRLFGMNEAADRLPGYLFALLGCATTALLARRLFDMEAAIYSCLAALTMFLPLVLAQSPAHDIALVPWINLLVLAFWEQENAGAARSQRFWFFVMAACVALALVTKGLIGLAVICSGLAIFVFLSRSLSRRMISRTFAAFAIGGLLASPWFLLMERASPGYSYYYFVERHFLGFVTEGQEHGSTPWHYYFCPVVAGSMPWFLFAVVTVWQRFCERKTEHRHGTDAVMLLACWFGGGYLFLTLAGSKLLTYSLPIFPPIAILGAIGFQRFFQNRLDTIVRVFFVYSFRIVAVAGILLPAATLMVTHYSALKAPSPVLAYIVAFTASGVMALAWYLLETSADRRALAIGVLWFPLAFVLVMTWPLQTIVERYSQKQLAYSIRNADEMPQRVVLVGQRVGSFLFYLSPAERTWFKSNRVCEISPEALSAFTPPPEGTIVAVTQKFLRRSQFQKAINELKPVPAGGFYVIRANLKADRTAEREGNTKK